MNREGHAGLSLLIFSLLVIPFGWSMKALMFIMFSAGFSSLPDLDQSWHIKHRAYTHNIGFGLIFGTIFGILFGYAQGILFGVLIFLAVLGGVLSHLLGEMIAGLNYDGSPWEIEPLQPFSNKSIGYGIYKATDKTVNEAFLRIGGVGFIFYVLISKEILQDVLKNFISFISTLLIS